MTGSTTRTISGQQRGYIKIEGVISQCGDGISAAIFRQMLDQAGLSNVPLGVAPTVCGNTLAGEPDNVTTYNASTPQNPSSYPTALSVYRQVMAANPASPVMSYTH